jgi:SH3-like domain-containing protein
MSSGRKRGQVPFSFTWLNHPQPKEVIENIRHAIRRSRPYGSEPWVSKAVAQFGLENTIRNPWRPEKGTWNV